MSKNYILDIIPLTKIPLMREQCFYYLSDKKLAPGALVSITFARRKIEGIVIGSRDSFPGFGNIYSSANFPIVSSNKNRNIEIGVRVKLKKIDKILEENFLDKKQITLANFISDYYISPLGIVMKNFVPKRTKGRKYKVESLKREEKIINLTMEQQNAVNVISKLKIPVCQPARKNSKFLLFGPSGSGKTEVYIHSILKIKEQNKNLQFLILVPEKTLIPQALERYSAHFKPEETVIISSNLSKGQFYANWQKIKSGKAKIIIGTRMAIFAPFKNLGLIVIDEEQDMSYKQWDMNPRYDARTCAEKLAEIYKCAIVKGSATPSIESYWQTENKNLILLKLPTLPSPPTPLPKREEDNFEIVDMRKERWTRNYSCISKKLKSEIEYALKYKQQVILFINRQGMSNFAVCEACKTVMKCPKCDRALIYSKAGYYKCAHCNYKTEIIPKCAKCGGIIFKNVGLGTQKVEKEIVNFSPLARILVADAENARKKNFQSEIYAKFSKGEVDILIGTQMISKGWDLPQVSLIGIIDADNLLSFPDFFAEEKVFQNIVQISGRTNRPGAKFRGTVVIQTFQPEKPVIKLATEKNYADFFDKEIEERKNLSLPPFGRIIKLVFQDYSWKKVEAEMERVYKILKKIPGIKISESHNPLLSKIRSRFRQQMIIKYKIIPAKLKKELKKLTSGWIVDVDPISIV